MVMLNNFDRKISQKINWRLLQSERDLLKTTSHRVQNELMRHQLSAVTGRVDDYLLDCLIELGFDSENLVAIRYAPVAEVAWASGKVTQHERVFAVTAAFESDMQSVPAAFDLFKSWLEKRPNPALWALWEEYTVAQLECCGQSQEEGFGHQLYEIASRVARASGGLLDQGDVCVTEQRVLDRIARVYRLSLMDRQGCSG